MQKVSMNVMKNVFYLFLLAVVSLAVLYLSWVSSPKIGGILFIPSWVGYWVDSYSFIAIRTAIPLVFLGILAGLIINYNQLHQKFWGIAWLLLSLLVCLAEIGQYFRPLRSFDWKDIAWGTAGAGIGLGIAYIARLLWDLIKKK